MVQLGGHPIYARGDEIGMDERESVEDVVRILQGYHAVIAARVFFHDVLQRMVDVATVPIVNLLSDRAHPLQAIADAMTMEEALGSLEGRAVAWVGDYNNVARSLGEVCALLGADVRFACPFGYHADDQELERLALLGAASVSQTHRPADAVSGADAVHADTWVSMGQEDDAAARKQAFEGFTVDRDLMALAAPGALFMHCLPAHRGLEVAADVIDGPHSVVVRQGHLRLAAARGAGVPAQVGRRAARRRPTRRVSEFRASEAIQMSTKQRRQQTIARLIGQRAVGNQPQLLQLLADEGIAATQATVSRDLDELGAIKVRVPGGQTAYAMPELESDRLVPFEQLRRVLGEWVGEVSSSANLVILRTPPGCAHVVASALDRSALDGLLGTVAGDDTVLCVAASDITGEELACRLRSLSGLGGGGGGERCLTKSDDALARSIRGRAGG